jgi:hypothetical protein
MKTENEKKQKAAASDWSERIRRKAVGAAANESSVAAELKNREHSKEQPAR